MQRSFRQGENDEVSGWENQLYCWRYNSIYYLGWFTSQMLCSGQNPPPGLQAAEKSPDQHKLGLDWQPSLESIITRLNHSCLLLMHGCINPQQSAFKTSPKKKKREHWIIETFSTKFWLCTFAANRYYWSDLSQENNYSKLSFSTVSYNKQLNGFYRQ